MSQKPLAGVRVVEFGTLIAGPFCTRILAEFGAEVVKIEAPGEDDPLRSWRKPTPRLHKHKPIRAFNSIPWSGIINGFSGCCPLRPSGKSP